MTALEDLMNTSVADIAKCAEELSDDELTELVNNIRKSRRQVPDRPATAAKTKPKPVDGNDMSSDELMDL